MKQTESDNLSKGDVISFIAILLMGIIAFFGMNFITLGDKIPSILVALLLVVLMTVFVFLAAHAKAQNVNQDAWRVVQYVMLLLYVVALVPCYIFSAKFFDIQVDKRNVKEAVQQDLDDINGIFKEYKAKSDVRCFEYEADLERMIKSQSGREKVAKLLELQLESVSGTTVKVSSDTFEKMLLGSAFANLEAEKDTLVGTCNRYLENWNILLLPQYVAQLEEEKTGFVDELKDMYENANNPIAEKKPELELEKYTENKAAVTDLFTSLDHFSIGGLLMVIFLGILGLVKFFLGKNANKLSMPKGDATVIREDGGIYY